MYSVFYPVARKRWCYIYNTVVSPHFQISDHRHRYGSHIMIGNAEIVCCDNSGLSISNPCDRKIKTKIFSQFHFSIIIYPDPNCFIILFAWRKQKHIWRWIEISISGKIKVNALFRCTTRYEIDLDICIPGRCIRYT